MAAAAKVMAAVVAVGAETVDSDDDNDNGDDNDDNDGDGGGKSDNVMAVAVTAFTSMSFGGGTLLAVLMAIAMRRYYTVCIARWRRFVAFIKATKRHHRVRTHSDITQSDTPTLVVLDISS
jgi:hypothetical protein